MSFDTVDGAILLLNNQVLSYEGGAVSQGGGAPELANALFQMNAPQEGGAILRDAGGTIDVGDDLVPAFTFNPDMPDDDVGGAGYFEVHEPAINVPEGFTAADLYATEFILDPLTGILTIKLYFSTDPLDFQAPGLSPSLDSVGSLFEPGSDSLSEQQANGSKCVVTVTRTTTTTSGSSSFTALFGLFNWTTTSGSSGSTSTTTVTLEGVLVNGRCFINRGG